MLARSLVASVQDAHLSYVYETRQQCGDHTARRCYSFSLRRGLASFMDSVLPRSNPTQVGIGLNTAPNQRTCPREVISTPEIT